MFGGHKVIRLDTERARRRASGDGVTAGPDAPSETLGQAYLRCHDEMRRFLAGRTGNRDAAEDLMQEVWLRIASRADDTGIDNPDAWLQRLVINLSLTWLRKHRFRGLATEPFAEGMEIADDAPDASVVLADRQRVARLRGFIDEMPPRRRAVFILYRGRGLSLQETADQLGISIKTVKAQMTEAIAFLRGRMMDNGLWP